VRWQDELERREQQTTNERRIERAQRQRVEHQHSERVQGQLAFARADVAELPTLLKL
jgi:hypothetical protein